MDLGPGTQLGFDETAILKTQDLKTAFGKPCISVFKAWPIQRSLSLWGRRTPFGWWIKLPSLQKKWQEDTIWGEDTLERAYTLVALYSQLSQEQLGQTWSWALSYFALPSQSGFFFVLFSSDSSCHNKLRVMLECKLLVQAESFDFEPSGGLALRPIHANM